ncbi:hypothetical protein JCM1841_006129 [Sporobolomyces salmonicolor]
MSRYAPLPVPTRGPPRTPKVDREKTCPFLLRVFVRDAVHHPDTAFSTTTLPTQDEHQVYVWSAPSSRSLSPRTALTPGSHTRRDSTIREILVLLRDASPTFRASPLARYSLRLVFWDAQQDRFTSQDLASVSVRELVSGPGPAGSRGDRPAAHRASSSTSRLDKTLAEAKFVIGDYLDVAQILPHHAGGPPSAPGPAPAAARAGPPFAVRGTAAAQGGFGGGPPFGPPGRGGLGGGFGPRGAMPPPRADTWARPPPVAGGPPAARGAQNGPAQWGPRGGGAGAAAAGGRGGAPSRPPQDQGWGNRRRPSPSEHEDHPEPRRRRDSRSLSPAVRRPSSRSPSRSPPPPRRRDSARRRSVDMRD